MMAASAIHPSAAMADEAPVTETLSDPVAEPVIVEETVIVDDTPVDETVTDETVTDETATDETITDETATDETVTEETPTEEIVTDESIAMVEGNEPAQNTPKDSPLVKVTIYKVVCEKWSDVARNAWSPGDFSALPAGITVNDLGPSAPAAVTAPGALPAGCALTPGYFFVTGVANAVGVNGTGEVAQSGGVGTGSDGSVTFTLSQAQSNAAWADSEAIALSEVRSSTAAFAALRCNGDNAFGDNWESLVPGASGNGDGIICVAYNVRPKAVVAETPPAPVIVVVPVVIPVVAPVVTAPVETVVSVPETVTTAAPVPAVTAPTQVAGETVTAPAVSPAATIAATGVLPRTGNDITPLLVGGLGLVALGTLMSESSRRRRLA
jgi:hypothetical protein